MNQRFLLDFHKSQLDDDAYEPFKSESMSSDTTLAFMLRSHSKIYLD